jgi:hypothetical protein
LKGVARIGLIDGTVHTAEIHWYEHMVYGQPTFYAGIAIFNSWYWASTSVTKMLTAPCDVNDHDGKQLCLESIPNPFLTLMELICNGLT